MYTYKNRKLTKEQVEKLAAEKGVEVDVFLTNNPDIKIQEAVVETTEPEGKTPTTGMDTTVGVTEVFDTELPSEDGSLELQNIDTVDNSEKAVRLRREDIRNKNSLIPSSVSRNFGMAQQYAENDPTDLDIKESKLQDKELVKLFQNNYQDQGFEISQDTNFIGQNPVMLITAPNGESKRFEYSKYDTGLGEYSQKDYLAHRVAEMKSFINKNQDQEAYDKTKGDRSLLNKIGDDIIQGNNHYNFDSLKDVSFDNINNLQKNNPEKYQEFQDELRNEIRDKYNFFKKGGGVSEKSIIDLSSILGDEFDDGDVSEFQLDAIVNNVINNAIKTETAFEKQEGIKRVNEFAKDQNLTPSQATQLLQDNAIQTLTSDEKNIARLNQKVLELQQRQQKGTSNRSGNDAARIVEELEKAKGEASNALTSYKGENSKFWFEHKDGIVVPMSGNKIPDEATDITTQANINKEQLAELKAKDFNSLKESFNIFQVEQANFEDRLNTEKYDVGVMGTQGRYFPLTNMLTSMGYKEKDNVFKDVSLRDMVSLSKYQNNTWGNFDNINPVSKQDSDKATIYQGSMSEYVDILAATQIENEAKTIAYNDVYLMNMDPGSIERSGGFRTGFDTNFFDLGQSRSENLGVIQDIMSDSGMEITEKQAKNFERTFQEELGDIALGLPKIAAEFYLANLLTGGVANVLKLNKMQKVYRELNTFSASMKAHAIGAMKESFTMGVVTGDPVTGAGFYGVGQAFGTISKAVGGKFKDVYAPLNNIILKPGQAGISFATASQGASFLKAAADDFSGGKDYNSFLNEKFNDIPFFKEGGLGRELLGEFATGLMFGAARVKGYDISLLRGKGNKVLQELTKAFDKEKSKPIKLQSKAKLQKIQEGISYVNNGLFEMQKEAAEVDPDIKAARVTSELEGIQQRYKKDLGVEFDFEVQKDGKGLDGDPAKVIPTGGADGKPLVLIDPSKYKQGMIPHEIFHVAGIKLGFNSPESMGRLRNILEPVINKTIRELEGFENFDLAKKIKEQYADTQDKSTLPEEYITNVIELLQKNPQFRQALTRGTILSDLKQNLTSFVERRLSGGRLDIGKNKLEFKTPQELLRFLDRFGKDIGKTGSANQMTMLENMVFDGKRVFNKNTGKYIDPVNSKDLLLEKLDPEAFENKQKISAKSLEIAKRNLELNKPENFEVNEKGETVLTESTKKALVENNLKVVELLANKAAKNPNILALEKGKRVTLEDWRSGYAEELVKLTNTYRPKNTPGDFGAYMMANLKKRYGNVLDNLLKGKFNNEYTVEAELGQELASDDVLNRFESEDLSIGNRGKLTPTERELITPVASLTKNPKEAAVLENKILDQLEGVNLSIKNYKTLKPDPAIVDAISDLFSNGKIFREGKDGNFTRNQQGELIIDKKSTVEAQKNFIESNAEMLYDILPNASMKRAEGLSTSTGIQPVIIRNLYKNTGKRATSKEGTTAGLKIQTKPEWTAKVKKDFLNLFGANQRAPKLSTGSIEYKNQVTAINALIRETAKSTLNNVARFKSLDPKDIQTFQQIADGKSDALASLDLTLAKDTKYDLNKLKLSAALMSKGKFDEANKKYPVEASILEVYIFEKSFSDVIDNKKNTPTFKKLADLIKDVKISTEFGEISMEDILTKEVGTGMVSSKTVKGQKYKIYNKARIQEFAKDAISLAETWDPKLKDFLNKDALLQSLGFTQSTTGMNTKSGNFKVNRENNLIYKDPFFNKQADLIYNAIGAKYKKSSNNPFSEILEGASPKDITQQKKAFEKSLNKNLTEAESIEILKKAINPQDNAQRTATYNAFVKSQENWLKSSKTKEEFIQRSKYIMQAAASNTNLIKGFGRQFVGVDAVLMEKGDTVESLKIEHVKSSLSQSFEVAKSIIEGSWDTKGPELIESYKGVLSFKKYLDVIDKLGGATNESGIKRMVVDFENLKKYRTVESDFKETLYDNILKKSAKEFNTNIKTLSENSIIDNMALYGFTQSPASKLLLETAIKNKKQKENALKINQNIAVNAGIKDIKNLSSVQLIEKLKEKDKTNQKELIESYASKDLNLAFNEIIENKTGIGKNKTYSKAKAAVVGAKSGKTQLIASSAQDFEGLLYRTLGKGEIGNTQKKLYEEYLYTPLAQAEANLAKDRVVMANNFKQLKKQLKVSPSDLRKNIEGQPWSKEQAVRVYIWDTQGVKIPDLTKSDLKLLTDFVKKDPKLAAYAQELILLGKGTPYADPSQGWEIGTITTDLIKGIQVNKRNEYLAPFVSNAEIMFSEQNMNKLEAAFGTNYRIALQNSLDRIKAGKNRLFFNSDSGSKLENRVLDYINNSTGAIMFLNTRSAVLQTTSAMNFINWKDNNVLAAGKAFANQPQYWKDFSKLMNSDYLVDRRQGLRLNVAESEIADAVHDQSNKPKAALNWLLKKGFLPTQYADSFAIASGGATFYRNRIKTYKKEGLSEKEAENKAYIDFMQLAEKSQQSSKAQRISMQQASGLGRTVLAFANTPAQYLRLSQKAASDLKNGRGSKVENISKLAYYSVAQNILFTTLQQASVGLLFDDDDDDSEQVKKATPQLISSMADNLLRGAGIGGQVVVTAKGIAEKIYKESEKPRPKYSDSAYELLNFSPPISSKVKKIRSAGRTVQWNGGVSGLMEQGPGLDNPAYLAGANVVSALTNVPLDRAVKKVNNIAGAMNENNANWQRIALMMGWDKWSLGIKNKPKKKEPITDMDKLYDLNKKQQIDSLTSLGISRKQIKALKLEEDRVNAILNPKSIKQIKVSKKDSLFGLNKKDQVKALEKLGLTKKEIRALRLESDRVEAIINQQKEKVE